MTASSSGPGRVDDDGAEPADLGRDVDGHGRKLTRPASSTRAAELAPSAGDSYLVNDFTSVGRRPAWGRPGPTRRLPPRAVKRIADSTVRRLSVYLRYLEELAARGIANTSSDELAQYGATTSAQVRKDLSFFGSFGTRGLGYSVAELSDKIREILGLGREWKVVIIGAGKIGSALSAYRGLRAARVRGGRRVRQRPGPRSGSRGTGSTSATSPTSSATPPHEKPDIAVLAIPADDVQAEVDRIVRAGITRDPELRARRRCRRRPG